jgi:hypothetical protein
MCSSAPFLKVWERNRRYSCCFGRSAVACVVAIVVLSLVPGDARPDTGLPGQIVTSLHIVVQAAFLGWDIRPPSRVSGRS